MKAFAVLFATFRAFAFTETVDFQRELVLHLFMIMQTGRLQKILRYSNHWCEAVGIFLFKSEEAVGSYGIIGQIHAAHAVAVFAESLVFKALTVKLDALRSCTVAGNLLRCKVRDYDRIRFLNLRRRLLRLLHLGVDDGYGVNQGEVLGLQAFGDALDE